MSETSERTEALKATMLKAAAKMKALEEENRGLKSELDAVKGALRDKNLRIEALTEDFNRMKLAKSVVTSTGDKAEMKFKVNEMVKEIDRCIALLNR